MIPIEDQGPLRRALIAQPVVFYLALLLPSTNKRRSRRLARLRKAIGFYQEELPFPQSEKRFVALYVGTMAKHGNNYFLLLIIVEERSKQNVNARGVPTSINCSFETFPTFCAADAESEFPFAE